MNKFRIEKDFRDWYKNNEYFQSLSLIEHMSDRGDGILFDGEDISPELKGYGVEFSGSDYSIFNSENKRCTFGSPSWTIECRICNLNDKGECESEVALGRGFSVVWAFDVALNLLDAGGEEL